MVYMDLKIVKEGEDLVDLESGNGGVIDERRRSEDGMTDEDKKRKKKGGKKSSKPPRPPKSPSLSLDAADQKLIREISEMAMLKRARMERMKALKKMKNAKHGSSNSSLCALLTTVVFCILIIWQGFFSRGSSTMRFQGSPEPSIVGPTSGLISVQFYRNNSTQSPHGSKSASPNNVEQISGLDDHGEGSRMEG